MADWIDSGVLIVGSNSSVAWPISTWRTCTPGSRPSALRTLFTQPAQLIPAMRSVSCCISTLQALRRHPFARLLAAATLLCALLHHLVIPAHALAVFGTGTADIGADAAGEVVPLGLAEHKVGTGLADVGAIEQQRDMSRVCVLPSAFQAVPDQCETWVVTAGTLVDA